MRNKLFACALVGIVPLFMSGTALAMPMNFNFSGNNFGSGVSGGNEYDSVSMAVGGVSVDVTAYTIANNGSGNISGLSQITGADVGVYVKGNSNGSLGVRSNSTGDGYNMDGGASGSITDLDEGLLFSFSEVVSLNYINFDRFKHYDNKGDDDFNLTVDGVKTLVDFNGHDSSLLAGQVIGQFDEYDFSGITGQEFLFWADGNTDSFRIDRMKVSAVSVPEPATLLLFGVGLIGLGFARRKTAV